MSEEKKSEGLTRREFIRNGSFAVGGLVGGTLLGSFLINPSSSTQTASENGNGDHDHGSSDDYMRARMFFLSDKKIFEYLVQQSSEFSLKMRLVQEPYL
ncbi:twin-arginine translocation signal domain-containing protein [Geomicrobium sp. JCM 19055]|uniref:twin-arginine translocation signal domain-containing protein n=1 Tax=Geomicrobium sp. JCM 19055 TaxID=1460649 RepID=UPI00045EDDC5|nr:twin-arginine translocation signal domain-containing protein [Geomicrobium sp. JCM 19055]GAJ97898.1 hypothetical protein JCM19055_787 [Geomicrobium sp. JCM 19055]